MEDKNMTLKLSGRIDSDNAAAVEQELMGETAGITDRSLVLDASDLEYISSAGLRVILRLRKQFPDLSVINTNPAVYEILDMTGFTQMMTVEKAYRTISIEGCEQIGWGANSTIYRVDKDNVVKVYKKDNALDEIRREREMAKLALILGLPTAISYDIVRVNEYYGSVFELLNALSFSQILVKEPEKIDWCVQQSIDLLKSIHAIELPPGKLPRFKDRTVRWLSTIRDVVPPDAISRIRELIDTIPEDNHLLHGDFHTKNMMLQQDEVLLIDMETLSEGNPIFDFAAMFCAYIGFSELDRNNIKEFQGYDFETASLFWKKSLASYFDMDDELQIRRIEDKARVIGYVRMIQHTIRHYSLENEQERANVEFWKEQLLELLKSVDTLQI